MHHTSGGVQLLVFRPTKLHDHIMPREAEVTVETRAPPASARPRRSVRTQAERTSEARVRMMQAAIRICGAAGFEGLTLADVGLEAGYSRGLPAHHFGSKAGLARALLDHLTSGFYDWFQSKRPASPLAAIEFACSAYLRGARREPIAWQAFINVLGHSLTGNRFDLDLAAVSRRSTEAFRVMIEEGKAAGELRLDLDSELQAKILIASLRGLIATILSDPELDVDATVRTFVSNLRSVLAWRGLDHAA